MLYFPNPELMYLIQKFRLSSYNSLFNLTNFCNGGSNVLNSSNSYTCNSLFNLTIFFLMEIHVYDLSACVEKFKPGNEILWNVFAYFAIKLLELTYIYQCDFCFTLLERKTFYNMSINSIAKIN